MRDPADLGVQEVIEALSAGDVTALELTERCLSRIKGAQGKALNAFIHVGEAASREQARESDRRRATGQWLSKLDGLPIGIKDNIDVSGMPTTNGLATQWMPDEDASVVKRLRHAGVVFLGKLNMHEGALGATTNNPHHGRCMHPTFPGFTPGGSSGGSAAAVAGGLCPVSLGTDTMGSVRLPAAYCGLVGFKPSRDYWPIEGVMPLGHGLDTIGPLARSVSDIAVLLQEVLVSIDLTELRFSELVDLPSLEVDSDCLSAYETVLRRLASSGVSVAGATLDSKLLGQARRAGFVISEVDGFAAHQQMLASQPEAFSPAFAAMLEYGRHVTPDRYEAKRALVQDVGQAVVALFSKCDVAVSLTTPQRAFSFEESPPDNQADLTALANFAGCPSISLPLSVSPSELPVGFQLMSAPGTDAFLLSVAAQVEAILKD